MIEVARESMDAIDDLGHVLVIIQIGSLWKEDQASGPPSKQQPTKKNSVVPDSALCVTIQEEMDTVTKDGETDFEEFSEWAKNHNLTKKQAKMMWNDLDRNHDKHVTSKEWDEYIQKRPNLKWLVTRLQSCRRT